MPVPSTAVQTESGGGGKESETHGRKAQIATFFEAFHKVRVFASATTVFHSEEERKGGAGKPSGGEWERCRWLPLPAVLGTRW